jgi:starvation-inducible DNA-binding protein
MADFAARSISTLPLEDSMAATETRGYAPDIETGMPADRREEVAAGLARLLADNFHWNVTGPMFHTLHLMFQEQYTELAAAVDRIAERIRALGFPAPGSYKTYARLASIAEAEDVPSAEEMIAHLLKDQVALVRLARRIVPAVEAADDEASADLLADRMQVHEKNAWMLRSLLER